VTKNPLGLSPVVYGKKAPAEPILEGERQVEGNHCGVHDHPIGWKEAECREIPTFGQTEARNA
jgi:hypothetical protein